MSTDLVITSRANPQFRQMLAWAQGKPAGDERLMVIDGEHLCESWLQHLGPPVQAWFDPRRVDALAALWRGVPAACRVLADAALLGKISTVAGDQGVCFAVRPPEHPVPRVLDDNSLWLDRIQDPGNLGNLLRTAAAAGVDRVFLSEGCAAAWTPRVLRAGQGAHFVLPIHEKQVLSALCDRLRVPLVATSLEGASSLYGVPLPRTCAWVMGNEGQGVAADLLARADLRIMIPQDRRMESLNVAVAAGICLFEQRRQLTAASQ